MYKVYPTPLRGKDDRTSPLQPVLDPFTGKPFTATASFGRPIQGRLKPAPAPAPNRPDEFWWVELEEGMPPWPARVSFRGDEPHAVLTLGDDCERDLSEGEVRLVAPVPAYGADQVVITREDFVTMWDALRWIGREAPSFDWLDALKARVDAQAGEVPA